MKKVLFLLIICIFSLQMKAQDCQTFKGHLCNNEFRVYLDITTVPLKWTNRSLN